jgi:hypothetical protein
VVVPAFQVRPMRDLAALNRSDFQEFWCANGFVGHHRRARGATGLSHHDHPRLSHALTKWLATLLWRLR